MRKLLICTALLFAFSATASLAGEVNERDAKRVLKISKCTNCHSVTKEKDAPPYKEIAAKYADDPDAEAKLYEHMTTSPMVEVDGKEEKHEQVKVDDRDQVMNLVRWILTR